jgi:hypothetical protein
MYIEANPPFLWSHEASTPNPQPASETRTIDFDKLPKVNIPPRQPQSVPEISSPVATSATTQTAQPMSPRSAAAARAAATPTRKSSVVVKPEYVLLLLVATNFVGHRVTLPLTRSLRAFFFRRCPQTCLHTTCRGARNCYTDTNAYTSTCTSARSGSSHTSTGPTTASRSIPCPYRYRVWVLLLGPNTRWIAFGSA